MLRVATKGISNYCQGGNFLETTQIIITYTIHSADSLLGAPIT